MIDTPPRFVVFDEVSEYREISIEQWEQMVARVWRRGGQPKIAWEGPVVLTLNRTGRVVSLSDLLQEKRRMNALFEQKQTRWDPAARQREEDARWWGRPGNKLRKKARKGVLGRVLWGC